MRILYVWGEARTRLNAAGGDVVHVVETVRSLRALGHDVDLVSAGDARFNNEAKRAYRSIRRLLPRAGLRAARELYEILHDRRTSRDLSHRLAHGGYDGVYERYSLFHRCGVYAAHRYGLPVVVEVNGTVRETEEYYGLSLKSQAMKVETAVLGAADAIIVVAEALREELTRKGIPPEKIVVLPNGVDPALSSRPWNGDVVRRELGLGDRPVIGFVGSFSPWHDLPTLVAAFEEIVARHDARLLLVGDGVLWNSIVRLVRARRLQNHVILPGRVAHESVPAYVAAMDVAVAPYPCIQPFHFSPIKLFEYMAIGRPVVTVPLGELSRMVQVGHTGVFYEPGSPASLARVIMQLLDDPPFRTRLGIAARSWVLRERTWLANARRIIDVFHACPRFPHAGGGTTATVTDVERTAQMLSREG